MTSRENSGIEVFFKPKSIAVIGASPKPNSLGNAIMRNLLESFKGKIYPVNPKYNEIMGLKTYPNIESLPEAPDLAVVTIRAELAVKAVEDAGRKGTKGVIVVAGGFAESGPEGEKLEHELVEITRKYGMRLIGPNCIGVYDAVSGVDTFFIPRERMRRPPKGPIAVISQSGAFLSTFMDFIATENVGVLRAVNFGNKADVDEVDILFYLADDPEIKTIMMYLEDVRPGRGQLFMKAVHEVRRNGKHIIVLKGGRTGSGARAAKSHTAAIAGDYEVFSSALKQAGIVEVYTVYEFVDAAKAVAMHGGAKGRNTIVLTNAGGPGVLSTDLLASAGLKVPSLPEDIKRKLREIYPRRVAVGNPIDLTGDAKDEDYRKVLEILADYEFGDIIFIVALLQPPTLTREIYEEIKKGAEKLGKDRKVIVVVGGSPDGDYAREQLNKMGIPAYPLPSRAVTGTRAIYLAGRKPCHESWNPISIVSTCSNPVKIPEQEALKLAEKYGVNIPNYCMTGSLEEALSCMTRLKPPIVAKIVSENLIHKSDVGGVILDIMTPEDLRKAYMKFENIGKKYGFQGILLMEQVKGEAELFIGARRDPAFGPVVVFGAGGITVELYKDTSTRIAPLTRCDVEEMISETKIGKLLEGYRGIIVNKESIINMILNVSKMIVAEENIAEVDLNPVIAGREKAYAVDVRINRC